MQNKTKEELIAFERDIADLWERGDLPFLIHLAGGNEDDLIAIFEDVKDGDWVLASHRNHFHYLLAGGSEADLEQKIRGGKSMFIFDKRINFMSSAILGGMCGIAAGLALAIKLRGGTERVWCFLGDGAADNGHLCEAAQYIYSTDLPCVFVVEDNDRSCGVNRHQRGTNRWVTMPPCVIRYRYTATWPHAGSGCQHKITFNPEIVKQFTP